MVTIWWLFFFSALGLCLGSFLNVVVYRLPMGLALSRPVWSFCPQCHNQIAWYDNLPVIGYVRLRGRCRNCWQPISPRYALIEIATAILVLALLDRFFIGTTRAGWGAADLNWRIADDWPIFAANIILFTSLLAMSAIDIQFYWVDIRFTHFAAAAGVVLHALWTPATGDTWNQPFDGTAITTVAAFVGFGVVWLLIQFVRREPPPADHDDSPDDSDSEPNTARKTALWALVPPLILFLAVLWFMGAASIGSHSIPPTWRAAAVLLFFFLLILYEASHVREADTEIVDAIESEAPDARQMTFRELLTLLPGLLLGAAAIYWAYTNPTIAETFTGFLHWRPTGRTWQPLWGMATAINGYVIAAGIGWTIRIIANMAYGKEAFATGDIHMMAAAGAVIGWQTVLIGFVIACFSAVFAWVALLPVKKTRAIPLGPWLWIGFLTAVLFHDQLAQLSIVQSFASVWNLLFFDISQHTLFTGAG